jgi:phosphoribosylaminoimidazolecarboxamide formyltransferase/IMP cyclohydrolase
MNQVRETVKQTAVRNVLVSTFDKKGLEEFVPELIAVCPDVHFYSTGGTYTKLESILGGDSKKKLTSISDYTGQPEMQGGLVKTLDFKIYLGLLNEPFNPEHNRNLQTAGAVSFDMVVVNLYPFTEVTAKKGVKLEEARANIDIGGPCMLRAAAKNFIRVLPVCDPDDYADLLHTLKQNNGTVDIKERFMLARKAFAHTSAYDRAISDYLFGFDPDGVVPEYQYRREE